MKQQRKSRSKFFEVTCECGNQQLIFSHASTIVKCLACENPLTKPRGGKTVILAKEFRIVEGS